MEYSSNFTTLVNNLVSELVNSLLTSVDSNVFSVLDELAFIRGSTIFDKYFLNFFTKQSSIVALAEALIFGILIYYSISYLFSFFTCSNFQKPHSFLFKLVLSAILIHFSLQICEKILDAFYLLSDILKTIGSSILSMQLSFSLLYEKFSVVFNFDTTGFYAFFTFEGLLKSFLSFMFVNLLFTYAVRFVFVKILVLLSPFAFLSLALDQSTWIFKIWLKNLISQLFTQLIVCLVLLIIFSFTSFANPIITKLLYVASIICLMKVSSFVKDFSSGFTSDISSSLSSIKNLV